jgi:transcriptional regulator with XRE-family HTH domain
MENVAHWTHKSSVDFVYNISSGFVSQLETKMEEENVSRSEMAHRLGKTNGRVSQVFNDPGNLSLRVAVEYAGALGMKVGLIAYDDGDSKNENGPIIPDVFVRCWERSDRPKDLFEIAENTAVSIYDLNLMPNVTFDTLVYAGGYPIYYSPAVSEEGTHWYGAAGGNVGAKWIVPNQGLTQRQGIINGLSMFTAQEFAERTGVVYAKQKAIGT